MCLYCSLHGMIPLVKLNRHGTENFMFWKTTDQTVESMNVITWYYYNFTHRHTHTNKSQNILNYKEICQFIFKTKILSK